MWTLSEDWSDYLAKEGIKIDFISAGEFKCEGGRFWEPLSDETRAHLQAQVDDIHRQFKAAVAKGRGTTVADVTKNFGEGRVFDANEALERGMIDRIDTFENTITRLAKMKPASATTRAHGGTRAAVSDADACPTCHGSGLKPEAYMGDPNGQEPCPDCNGTGKTAADAGAADTAAAAQVAADADCLALTRALTDW